jgi:uncharacterized protein (TIGR02147 family)
MGIFQHFDYRLAIRDFINEHKSAQNNLSYSSYAEAIGVQNTFVSKVFNQNAHLSEDHLYLSFDFLKFTDSEIKYLRVLYDFERTGLHERKNKLKQQILSLQEENRQFRIHTSARVLQPELDQGFGEYYLDPMNLIVHAYLGIQKYCDRPEALHDVLPMPPPQVNSILETLQRLKIINRLPSGNIQVIKPSLHLDIRSIFCSPHQMLFRIKSTEQIMKLGADKRFIFSLTFSGNHDLKGRIQDSYLRFIKEIEKMIDENKNSDRVYQLNFDLFPWMK